MHGVWNCESRPLRGRDLLWGWGAAKLTNIFQNIVVTAHSFGKSVTFKVGSFGKCNCSRRNISKILSLTVQEHFIACGEVVKLFSFLLSPYSLIEICNTVQNCTDVYMREGSCKIMYGIIVQGRDITESTTPELTFLWFTLITFFFVIYVSD